MINNYLIILDYCYLPYTNIVNFLYETVFPQFKKPYGTCIAVLMIKKNEA